MEVSAGCLKYRGLIVSSLEVFYRVPQVLGVLLVVSSMEVSTGCSKYWGLGVLLVVSSMEVSTGCIYKYMVFYRVSKYGMWILHCVSRITTNYKKHNCKLF